MVGVALNSGKARLHLAQQPPITGVEYKSSAPVRAEKARAPTPSVSCAEREVIITGAAERAALYSHIHSLYLLPIRGNPARS